MADYTIESHADDSVTLTLGPLTATIRSDDHRSAWRAAHALGALLTAQVDTARLAARIGEAVYRIRDVSDALDKLDIATSHAADAVREIASHAR